MKDKKYIEKKIRKYVIATFDQPTQYLYKIPGKSEYLFVEDIEAATKTLNSNIAEQVKQYYYSDTNVNIDLVVLPIDITYELVEETN